MKLTIEIDTNDPTTVNDALFLLNNLPAAVGEFRTETIPVGSETVEVALPQRRKGGRPRKNPQAEIPMAPPAPLPTPAPAPAPVAAPAPAPAPLAPSSAVTLDSVRAAMREAIQSAGPQPVQALFARFRVQAVSQLAPEQLQPMLQELLSLAKMGE